MPGLIPEFIIVSAFVVLIICMLLGTLAIVVGKMIDTNKQLMILVAGKEGKPETLRALVASSKPPQKNLKGIASGKKKDKKPENTNYTLEVGESNIGV